MLHCCLLPQSTHEDKDYVHIVMELCNGGELFDHIVEAQHFTERKVSSSTASCNRLSAAAIACLHKPVGLAAGSCVPCAAAAARKLCSCASKPGRQQ